MTILALLRWWRKQPARPLAHWHVVVYTRQGCHLCEVAWEQLRAARQQHGFELTAVDVDGNPELAARYGEQVPVVVVNGKVRFRGRINDVLLTRLLRAETRNA